MGQFIFVIVISLNYHMSPVGGAMRQQIGASVVLDRCGSFFCIFRVLDGDGQLDDILPPPPKKERRPQIHLHPRLQRFIQLYWYLYITGTLYSGEIIGRITHVTLCDAAQGHKYWCGRPEGDEGDTHTLVCRHLPVSIPTCTAQDSPDGHVAAFPPAPFSLRGKPPF